jgi:hypothetical protein
LYGGTQVPAALGLFGGLFGFILRNGLDSTK